MDGVKISMERSAKLMQWSMVGDVLVPGVLNTVDIDKTDEWKQTAELVSKFVWYTWSPGGFLLWCRHNKEYNLLWYVII